MRRELAIRTHQLTKQFDHQIAVNHVDLEIESGEVYGLIGPNGAGKTTLIRMLATAERPTTGEIHLNGQPLHHDPQIDAQLKRRLGYLPDDYPLYDDLTVWDYLDYFARLYHLQDPYRTQRLWQVLELVDLGHKRQSRIVTLSRGMRQRLSLARTIIHEPILLLLDEPVSGLDPLSRVQFRDIIKTLQAAGMTILISSHILSDLAELCSSVGIMELGHLVESARLSDLYHRLSRPQIRIMTLGDVETLRGELRNHPQVEAIERRSGEPGFEIEFSGSPQESADLLKTLVQAGIPITTFQPLQEDLESIFLKLGHQQSS